MDAATKRSGSRHDWPVSVCSLQTQSPATVGGSAASRLTALAELTAEGWRTAGRPLPDYERGDAPIRIIRAPEVARAQP